MEEIVCVSVLMSIYKEPVEWLKKSIESVLNQTYPNIQAVFVLDNPNYGEAKELLLG